MPAKKAFLLRLDQRVHEALQRWANDDLRSVNAQMEYLLRKALSEAGRLPHRDRDHEPGKGTAAP